MAHNEVDEWARTTDIVAIIAVHLIKGRGQRRGSVRDETFLTMLGEYRELRGTDKPLYNGKLRGSLMDQNILTLLTNFSTNVKTHGRVRVKRYLKWITGKANSEANGYMARNTIYYRPRGRKWK